jgi:tRNA G18 (ribose-2'-O)-methylase SpoU
MPRIALADLNDPRIAIYRALKATNHTRWLNQFVVEGEKLVERLLASRFPVVSVLVTDRHEPRLTAHIPDEIPTYVVPHSLIDSIVGFAFHRGILGCAEVTPWPALTEIVEQAGARLTLVICPQVSNPENLGAISRIADAFGVDAILAGPSCPDPLSRRVLRVSMGSILRVPLYFGEHCGQLANELAEEKNVVLMGAVADATAAPFDRDPRPDRVGLVLGDEDSGLAPEWIERCRRVVTIPMRTGAGSLNVAVAAAILLQSLTRDRCVGDPTLGAGLLTPPRP